MLYFNIKPIANRTEGTPNALKTMLELAQNAYRTSSYVHIYSGYIYIVGLLCYIKQLCLSDTSESTSLNKIKLKK